MRDPAEIGTSEFPPEPTYSSPSSPITLRAGPLEMVFEPDTGWVRQIRFGRREIVRAIYGAVRDRNWSTVLPTIQDLSIETDAIGDAGADAVLNNGFEIRFKAECRQAEIHFVWHARIAGHANGAVEFEFQGAAESNFLRNRIGLCVLFPIAGCAGEECQIEHTDGTTENGRFPHLISPVQPFYNLHALRQKLAPDTTLSVQFAGEVFEMEDQRNWTDASFKVYSTPLAHPFPVLVTQGELVTQSVKLELSLDIAADPRTTREPNHSGPLDRPLTLIVDFDRLHPKPRLGLGLAEDAGPLGPLVASRLYALRLDHLRVDCRLLEPDWPLRVQAANRQAEALSIGLHVALFVLGHDEAELRRVGKFCASLGAPVRLWLIFLQAEAVTPPALVHLARKVLTPFAPHAEFAAGTDANFAELNRQRPPNQAPWLPCCSLNPQVHACDQWSMIENLAAQTDLVTTVESFSARPLVLSTLTLAPRGNPNTTADSATPPVPRADPRQASLFAAGWTLGSLAALASPRSVHSLTYYETVGPRGIMANTEVFPMYHVFAAAAEMSRLAEVQFTNTSNTSPVTALAGKTANGRSLLWLANLTPHPISVRPKLQPGFRTGRLKSIDERNVAEAGREPEAWQRHVPIAFEWNSNFMIRLPRFGLLRLELET